MSQTTQQERAAAESVLTASGASLQVRDLRIKYGDVEAVKGISFSIRPGEFLTLLGPSGCGKTTTLRCIAGLEAPSGGSITLDDTVIASEQKQLPPEKRGINMVFQSYAVWPHMTVEKNVGYGLKGLDRKEVAARVGEVLSLVGLDPYAKRFGTELSGGQQQRVALARAIVTRPKLLLFDEPLSNLDAGLREQMRFELLELQRTVGITSVYVTHDQTEAMSMSDRVVLMRDGEIEQLDVPREIYRRPATEFAATFIGRANLIRAELADDAHVAVGDNVRIRSAEAYGGAGTGVFAVFRSENVVLGAPALECENQWSGIVERVSFLGRHLDVALRLPGGVIRAEVRSDAAVESGDVVDIGVRAHDVHFVPVAK
ncbi:ABC transporter ATP-binding protein [Microbacterium sp. P02]|uniref:ABC transporter ATP-binding protein n=1 Tax=Microbacterium sp. P02 TaxID=3366260 RepID=UPI003672D5B7